MAKRIQLRRGTTAQTANFTGVLGEVTVDTDKDVLVVHDGATAGGFPVAARGNADGTVTILNKAGTVLATIPSTGLLVNNLTSTTTNQALTAAQGKVLQDGKLGISSNAVSATKLVTARNINGVAFDGTADIDIAARLIWRGTVNSLTTLDNALSNGYYTVNNYGVAGLYGYGYLHVIGSGDVIQQTYYPHQPSGDNNNIIALRQTWGGSAAFSAWRLVGTQDATKLPLTGGTLTGNLVLSGDDTAITKTVSNLSNVVKPIINVQMGVNDRFRIGVGATASNAGYAEIATADDASEPIYVRQYTGDFATATRTLSLLDASGNTTLPENLYAGKTVIAGTRGVTDLLGGLSALGGGDTAYFRAARRYTDTTGWLPVLSSSLQNNSWGYVQHMNIGLYRPDYNWTNSGTYIATGGNDNYPTEAFVFGINGQLWHTSGSINLMGAAEKLNTASGAAPSYSARAWCHVSLTSGTPVVLGGANISSVVDNGVGSFILNFITAMPHTNFAVTATSMRSDYANAFAYEKAARTVSSVTISNKTDDAGASDGYFSVVIHC